LILAITQGDPTGIGPEVALRAALEAPDSSPERLVLVAERAALDAVLASPAGSGLDGERLVYLEERPGRAALAALPHGVVAVIDPVAESRRVTFGASGAADAAGALAALDRGIELAREGSVDALVTAPIAKHSIARHVRSGFRGHTDYIAAACGLTTYGRDYLMAFLAPDLRVALLTAHLPLREAIAAVDRPRVVDALRCIARHGGGRIAVAGLNPHAGEGGLLGSEDGEILAPAVAACRAEGLDVHGPESADSLFARARGGEFDWVLALYHDQGLVAVKTAAFGAATNWTMGLPFVRTSVDHGTAFELAGSGRADAGPMRRVLAATRRLVASGR
jgi:4-hydroxythreonine-4-phosphate dehydrogenase